MNIIQAIQEAENGALITDNFMRHNNRFLKYIERGVFFQYELIEKKPVYKFEVRNFSMADVLSIAWEILPENPFSELADD